MKIGSDSLQMSDDDFIEQFESAAFPATDFHHREHVKIVWLYLQRYTLIETLARFAAHLKKFAAANGKADLYHETITWSYVFLINERMRREAATMTWDEFVERNPDLLDWRRRLLNSYYAEDMLHSDLARQTFVFPAKSSAV